MTRFTSKSTVYPPWARSAAGQASISITADVYGHLIGTVASDAVNGAANLIAHTVHTPEVVST